MFLLGLQDTRLRDYYSLVETSLQLLWAKIHQGQKSICRMTFKNLCCWGVCEGVDSSRNSQRTQYLPEYKDSGRLAWALESQVIEPSLTCSSRLHKFYHGNPSIYQDRNQWREEWELSDFSPVVLSYENFALGKLVLALSKRVFTMFMCFPRGHFQVPVRPEYFALNWAAFLL